MSEPYWEPLAAAPAAGSAWVTGDTKVSAQNATHADPQGGTWYLANGSAIPAGETALIALLGANLPDAQGRSLVMKGPNTAIDTIGDSDGQAAANRTPWHKHTLNWSDPTHSHVVRDPGHTHHAWLPANGGAIGPSQSSNTTGTTDIFPNPGYTGIWLDGSGTGIVASVGPQASAMLDISPFVVPGNLFYHS